MCDIIADSTEEEKAVTILGYFYSMTTTPGPYYNAIASSMLQKVINDLRDGRVTAKEALKHFDTAESSHYEVSDISSTLDRVYDILHETNDTIPDAL